MRLFIALASLLAAGAAARAQPIGTRYAESPTDGVVLPTTPLAGDHDARAVTYNPGGLALLSGSELALGLDLADPDVATSSGQGFGIYAATVVGGHLIPRFAIGTALEWLRPPRAVLAPDPGAPFRFTLATAFALGRRAGIGLSWHHFIADGTLSGANAFDVGLSTRWGNHLAIGATLRDIATQDLGGTPVQRRYELEAVVRPLGTDRLALAIGGRVGEIRGDVDGWARAAWRAARGFTVLAQIESRELHVLTTTPTGTVDSTSRDARATVGIDISLGRVGATVLANGSRVGSGGAHALGTTLVARASTVGPPSIVPPREHVERVELSGDIDARALTKLVARMRAIARDRSAVGVIVVFEGASGGWATMQELRGELVHLRAKGKKVFAYMGSGTTRDYFVATAANKIYVDPASVLRLVGISWTTIYFRGAFDLVGVVPQYERIGEYKSAPEQLTETGPSGPAAKMHNELADSLYRELVAAIAEGRRLPPDEVKQLIDRGPYSAGDLAKTGVLVDAVGPPEKIAELVAKELGGAYPIDSAPIERADRWRHPGIAIVYVDGEIDDGKSRAIPLLGQKISGGQTVSQAIAAARADPRVGAIVLRIDSPGGSAVASELIAREVFATRGDKPIVCAASDLAASGGYFVAAGCETIFAEPMTITGSIGIFTGKFDVSGLLRKVGVTTDTYKRGAHGDADTYWRPYTDEERAMLAEKLQYMYGRFVAAVAEGRKLTKQDVDKVGRGRVWTGALAADPNVKLVDKLGGLGDAIAEAKRRMGLADDADVELYELPEPPKTLLGFVGNLIGVRDDGGAAALYALPLIRTLARGVPLSLLGAPDVPLARLPYDLSVE
jgi:protease-4